MPIRVPLADEGLYRRPVAEDLVELFERHPVVDDGVLEGPQVSGALDAEIDDRGLGRPFIESSTLGRGRVCCRGQLKSSRLSRCRP